MSGPQGDTVGPMKPETVKPEKPSDLLTLTDVATLLGVQRNTLTAHRTRGAMPAPDRQYGRTPLWRRSTIVRWRPLAGGAPAVKGPENGS